MEDEIRVKAKSYGRQASEMLLHPEQVFRGFLVSTLECQDCLHSSQRVESFLDLSLPVMADKVNIMMSYLCVNFLKIGIKMRFPDRL